MVRFLLEWVDIISTDTYEELRFLARQYYQITAILVKAKVNFSDVRRFRSKHSLIAYAGIDAPPYQSGAFNATERKISKRGNSYLRKTGYEIMQSLIQHKPDDDPVYDFIQKKRSEGKCGNALFPALVVLPIDFS